MEKITRALKDLYNPKINVDNDNKNNSTQYEYKLTKGESENKLNPEGTSCVLPVPSKETYQRGPSGITTHAVEAICARDMSVGVVNKMFINKYQNKI